ncbi:MAG: aldehyde dehydrogenase family protein, partial [Gammaproteobacteria bacterium]
MASIINHWINGELQPSTSERYGEVFNPATGEVSASVSMANSDDLNKAVEAASKAFESWSETSVTKRAQIFFKYKELIEANRDELIELITREHGKVTADAAGSLQRGIEVVDFICGIPHLLKGEFSE